MFKLLDLASVSICIVRVLQDARGDQCDKCGKLINATELKAGWLGNRIDVLLISVGLLISDPLDPT